MPETLMLLNQERSVLALDALAPEEQVKRTDKGGLK
jgi:hypothetical protein